MVNRKRHIIVSIKTMNTAACTNLSLGSDLFITVFETFLGLAVHTGVLGAIIQGGCLVQQPLQQDGLVLGVTQQDAVMVQLPALLFQAQLQLQVGFKSHLHLPQPQPKLFMGLQVLTPVQPHPLNTATEGQVRTVKTAGNVCLETERPTLIRIFIKKLIWLNTGILFSASTKKENSIMPDSP